MDVIWIRSVNVMLFFLFFFYIPKIKTNFRKIVNEIIVINSQWERKWWREQCVKQREKNICSWINLIEPVIVHHVLVQLYEHVWVRIVRWNWMKRREGRKNGRIEEKRKEKGWHRAKKSCIQNKNRKNKWLARSCFCLNKTYACNMIWIL